MAVGGRRGAAAACGRWCLVILALMRWAAPPDMADAPLTDSAQDVQDRGRPPDPAPPEAPNSSDGNVFGVLAGAAVVLLVLSIVATVVGRRRAWPLPPTPEQSSSSSAPHPAAVGPDLARAAELGLAEIGDASRDPRDAIIACYLVMERELEKSPGTIPQLSDTPAEVLARAIAQRVLHAGSATELVDLFEEARFSPHVMDEGHRADAERALRSVQRELQGAT